MAKKTPPKAHTQEKADARKGGKAPKTPKLPDADLKMPPKGK